MLTAKTAERYRLALVSAHPDGPHADAVVYVLDPFQAFEFGDFSADGVLGDWHQTWAKGGPPQ